MGELKLQTPIVCHSAVTANTTGTPFSTARISKLNFLNVSSAVTTGLNVKVSFSTSETGTFVNVPSLTMNITASESDIVAADIANFNLGWCRVDITDRTDGTISVTAVPVPLGA